MMNQLIVLKLIIGLEPFETFKINKSSAVIINDYTLNDTLVGKRVIITRTVDDSI